MIGQVVAVVAGVAQALIADAPAFAHEAAALAGLRADLLLVFGGDADDGEGLGVAAKITIKHAA